MASRCNQIDPEPWESRTNIPSSASKKHVYMPLHIFALLGRANTIYSPVYSPVYSSIQVLYYCKTQQSMVAQVLHADHHANPFNGVMFVPGLDFFLAPVKYSTGSRK